MSVTDGSLTTDGAQQTVRIIGTVTTEPGTGTQPVSGTVTANQGTSQTNVNGWFVKITDGTRNALVNTDGSLLFTTGTVTAPVTLNALSAVGPGVVVDLASAKQNISMVFLGTVASGTVVLDVSHDSSTWFQTGTPIAITTTAQNIAVSNNAFRYARGRITEVVTAGTVTATLMAS